MKRMFTLVIVLLTFVASSYVAYPLQKVLLQGFDQVLKLAKNENKQAIIVFSDPQCYYCNKLKKETLMDKTVQELLANNFVIGEVYPTQQKATFEGNTYTYQQLFVGFEVKGTPTLVFFTSDGTPITYIPGYMDAKNFSTVLRYIATKQYLKNVSFQAYAKEKHGFLGTPRIVKVTKEEAEYILLTDPLSTTTRIVPNGDKFLKYIVEGKDAQKVAEKMKKDGFYNVYLVEETH